MVFGSTSLEQFERPFERAGIITPGLPVLPIGVERHPIPAGGTRAVEVFAGDELTLVDRDGAQPAEVVFFAPDQKDALGTLGLSPAGRPSGIEAALSAPDGSGWRVKRALEKAGFDLRHAEAARLFGPESVRGNHKTFFAQMDGLLIACSVPQTMSPEEQNTTTELTLYIRRSNPAQGRTAEQVAPPLADTLMDFQIDPGDARAYEVKKGDYIQILDVKGRECTDFQAFSRRALDKGLAHDIDPTTTRSLMGGLWPNPGIYSKYFTVDHEPLLEIVQDTCGRHDTFGLACTARYYEELGYPGHLNCSDNITREVAAYGVGPKTGWPAINFFFNTMLDDTNAIGMDDPWSRPGDYVLMRALTDIVAVSSACPCDVDPANGWNPTEIQVRVYDEKEPFKRSIGWRKSPEAELEETKETGFHSCFAAHTNDFAEYNGFWLANKMRDHGAIEEYWAAREKAVVLDLSPLRKYEVTGPDAEELMQACVTRNMKKLSVGQVVYTAMCYDHGGMVDDGTVFRLGDNNFRWIGGNDDSGAWLKKQAEERQLNVWVRSSTDQLHNIAVQGPLSREILQEVIWTPPTQPDLAELGWFRLAIGRIGDYHGIPLVVSRTGYSGELGYEIFCHPKDAVAVFDAVWAAGAPKGMIPTGLEALDMLRIESGLIFANYEFDDQTDPFEAGIGFTVPLKSKTDDFTGREALERRKASPQRKLVGLDIESGLVPASGDCIRIGKAQVGQVTSAMKSPFLGKTIALARVDVTHAEVGTAVEIGQLDGQQKRLAAKVVAFPHFDPTKERVKGNYD